MARNRGALSMITTFDDEPYSGPFTGNVTELCPVGALLPTQYRFQARPWDIAEVPTVCSLCPVGCNVSATVREGKVKRIQSRNHPEIDEGWICDKGRFTFPHLRAPDRIVDPLKRVRLRGLEPVSWDEALDEAERLLRAARGRIVTALSGSESVEQAFALGALLRRGLDSHQAVMPEEISGALDAYRLPLSAIRDAQVVVVLGDVPLAERAPIVDLWVKAARRNGARVLTEVDEEAVRGAEKAVLIWCGPGGRGGATVAQLAERLGLAGKEGSGAVYVPETPNARGVADAWAACCDEEGESPEPIGLLLVSGDEAANDPSVRSLAERADAVIAISMFHGLAAGWADLVLPGTSYLERDGTTVNLEGRLQRQRRTSTPPCPDELEWLSQLAARFGVEISPHAPMVFAAVSELCFGGISYGDVGERAPLGGYPEAPAHVEPEALPEPAPRAGGIHVVAYKPLFSGPAVERVEELAFQRPRPEVALARADARAQRHLGRRSRHGHDRRSLGRARGTPLERRPPGRRPDRRRARAGPDRPGLASALAAEGGESAVTEPWWISLIKAGIIVNLVLGLFAYLTLIERKLMGRMQLRYGPNRAGKFGLLQPIADLVKLVRKEAFAPSSAIGIPYIIAPMISAFTALAAFSVIPWGPGWTVHGWRINGEVANVSIGLLLIFALGSIGIYGFIVGGWASESKYSILGAMRTCAQLVSYEVSLALSVLGVVILGRSLNLPEIVHRQGEFLPFVAPQFIGMLVFFFGGIAETSRAPFDLPEAEQELVAGYHTEYSGMRWGLFQMAEYINLITLSGLMVTLFFSGWHGPWNLGPLWFLLKLMGVLFVFIWLRTTLPRLRYDQLMRFGWKILLPVATLNAVVTAALVVAFR